MANRHLQRSVAMQSLFEWDFQGRDNKKIDAILERNQKEFAPGTEEIAFAQHIVTGILAKQKTIDQLIEKCAPEWPLKSRNTIFSALHSIFSPSTASYFW